MIGEIINGKYKIDAAFSESHMYEIFTALEVATGARVVVKILKEEMAVNPERVKGFSDEIRAFASLSHPLIAEVLDVDMYGDRPFVVSPIVKGKDLHTIIKDEVLSLADCGKISQDLATVLQHAADQKIEYRTIKLSNVLRQDDGRITVLSFTHPRLKLASRSARNEGSGVHSDLFFLGSTFFELLAGESPIRKRGGINELWDMKLEQLLRIRHADFSPAQLTRIVGFVRKTLTRDMSIRFNSHEEFLKALADLSGSIRENTIRNKTRQLSMASQVVDALNGRMSNVNMSMPPLVTTPSRRSTVSPLTAVASAEKTNESAESTNGFAQSSIEGNLALVVDNSSKDGEGGTPFVAATSKQSSRAHLRLVKPLAETSVPPENAEVWKNQEERHWLRNPVLIMGACLIVMVCLILFW